MVEGQTADRDRSAQRPGAAAALAARLAAAAARSVVTPAPRTTEACCGSATVLDLAGVPVEWCSYPPGHTPPCEEPSDSDDARMPQPPPTRQRIHDHRD